MDASWISHLKFKEMDCLYWIPRSIVFLQGYVVYEQFLKNSSNFGDAQTEVVNRSLGNLLRILEGDEPKKMELGFATRKFAYNKFRNQNTQPSPFEVVWTETFWCA